MNNERNNLPEPMTPVYQVNSYGYSPMMKGRKSSTASTRKNPSIRQMNSPFITARQNSLAKNKRLTNSITQRGNSFQFQNSFISELESDNDPKIVRLNQDV